MSKYDPLLEQGFQLAYFIFPDRATAIAILANAVSKLDAQCGCEKKRYYWRDKYLKRWINRISRDEGDTLQWLIYFQSEQYEKEQERGGEQTLRDMVVRYAKTLVRITAAISSFYVNVGLNRLLRNYTTAEAQRIYELVTERYLGTDEYRRAKGILMSKLQSRFEPFLKPLRTQHGEHRFEVFENQDCWAELISECLKAFTPWSTKNACWLPDEFNETSGQLPRLLSTKRNQDATELSRCHVFIDPLCYVRIARILGFDPPDKKLAIPRFFMDDTHDKKKSPRAPDPPNLTKQECKTIRENLAVEAARRRRATPNFLRVLVDGCECARIDVTQELEANFSIQEGAELLEIWTEESGKGLLLATHRISYHESQGIAPSVAPITLAGGKKLDLIITPNPKGAGAQERGASVILKYVAPSHLFAWEGPWRQLFSPMPVYALVGLALIAIGWFFGISRSHHELASQQAALAQMQDELSREKQARTHLEQIPPVVATREYAAVRLAADDSSVRGGGTSSEHIVDVTSQLQVIALELPVTGDSHRSYRAVLKPFLTEREILSENLLPVKQTATGPVAVFTLPSSLLASGKDYTVNLKYVNAAGKQEELDSFTFHVTNKK